MLDIPWKSCHSIWRWLIPTVKHTRPHSLSRLTIYAPNLSSLKSLKTAAHREKQQITALITAAWQSVLSSVRKIKLWEWSPSKEGLESSSGDHLGRSQTLPTGWECSPVFPQDRSWQECASALLTLPWSTYCSCNHVLSQADNGERGSWNCSQLQGTECEDDLCHYCRFVQQKLLKRATEPLRHHIYLEHSAVSRWLSVWARTLRCFLQLWGEIWICRGCTHTDTHIQWAKQETKPK